MKKQILTLSAVALFTIGSATLIGCGNSHEQNESAEQEAAETNDGTETTAEVYSCPMHAEITGVQSDTCSECGMDLTLSK